jgi:hypothetical protein
MPSVITAIGTLMKKIARHDSTSTSQPPSTGPSAVVTAEHPAQVPIALPRRSSAGKAALIIADYGDKERPADALNNSRCDQNCDVGRQPAANGRGREDSSAQGENASRPKRSPVEPPTRISAPNVSMYPLTTHCVPWTETFRSD